MSSAVLIALVATATGALTRVPTLHLDSADAQIVGVFSSVEDPDAPGGGFVHAENRFGNRRVFDGVDGAMFCFTVIESGEYTFSADVMGPNNGANSFWVRLDYFNPWVWEFAKSTEFEPQPVTDHNGELFAAHLEAGQHVVGFYLRESGARLAGVNIHGDIGTSDPQPCAGPDSEGSSSPQETTTTESVPATTEAPVTSTTESTPTTTVAPTTSTSEASTTSTAAAATTSTTAATTTSTSKATTTTVSGQFDVVISPSDDVNQILQAHPDGTSFLLKAGTYRRLTIRPKSGQSITGENGTVLDGEGRTPHAMGDETSANDVTLRNLEIINYTEFGIAWGAQGAGKGWVIENSEIASNYVGVRLKSDGTVRNSHVHHNTTYGVLASGRVVLEGNEIAFNHSESYPSGASGGLLLGRASNSIIRNNHIHHNYTIGLHLDGRKENVLIEGNTVEDNEDVGISYELGGSGMIRNNLVRRNGSGSSGRGGDGAGIMILGATDVTVQGNRVEGNVNGIVGRQPDRTNPDTGKLWELRNLRVVDNAVTMSQGWTGIYDRASGQPSLDANNVFEKNSYSTSGEHFRWGSEMMTLSEWQEIHPNDG
ncbi:MAG TPA: right-handed parallel beta-helix repeat-containing protein [Acidimicrobiia bacterium]